MNEGQGLQTVVEMCDSKRNDPTWSCGLKPNTLKPKHLFLGNSYLTNLQDTGRLLGRSGITRQELLGHHSFFKSKKAHKPKAGRKNCRNKYLASAHGLKILR